MVTPLWILKLSKIINKISLEQPLKRRCSKLPATWKITQLICKTAEERFPAPEKVHLFSWMPTPHWVEKSKCSVPDQIETTSRLEVSGESSLHFNQKDLPQLGKTWRKSADLWYLPCTAKMIPIKTFPARTGHQIQLKLGWSPTWLKRNSRNQWTPNESSGWNQSKEPRIPRSTTAASQSDHLYNKECKSWIMRKYNNWFRVLPTTPQLKACCRETFTRLPTFNNL